ncbi:MAG TPA: hypothetical protein VH592_09705 [Gemmataceae bacterium]|jgi:hypothetical protein
MHWEVLIIPLIALGVWIIGTLFKSEEEKTKKPAGCRGNAAGRAPGRRVVTDLDRFLEEARRRREPEAQRKPPPLPTREPAPRPPLRERPSRPQETPRVSKPAIVKEESVVVLPVPRSTTPPPIAEPAPTPTTRKLGELRAGAQQSREVLPVLTPATPTSPIVEQARSLLSKPQTAATAFVLREIFDRPLCKRRR